jgi:outer membrane protein OmpA-like peptidoglycan-associated protein/tetratricopeptide (TPR) repeat protein
MKLIRYSLPLVLLTFFLSVASAKENKDLMRANYYYSHYAYFEAIPYFEKVAGELNSCAVYSQLADCYSVTNNLQKAADAYSKAVKIPGCSSTVVLKYAQLLMELMQYEEAGKQLEEYRKTNANDKRAEHLAAACKSANSVLSAIPAGIAVLLPFNTDGSDFAPTIWKGQLVFTSDTAIDLKKKTDNWTGRSYYNIYTMPLAGAADGFNKLSETKEVNIKYHNGPCTFTADGKQMYYTRSRFSDKFLGKKPISNKDSVVLREIMIASDYDASAKKFKTIKPFQYNSEEYSVAHPSVSPNGKLLAFSSDMPKGAGGSDIYICKKMGAGWSKPLNAGNMINTEGEEVFPYWGDDATLFFSSDGHEGLGGLDIYKCTWDDKSGTFSKAENIGTPINSSYDDISLALLTDGGSTYFSSNRPAAKGGDNIYRYKKEKIFLQLHVVDSVTQQPLANVNVSLDALKDKKDKPTDVSGLMFTQLYPGEQYNISVHPDEYIPASISVTATGANETDTLFRTIKLLQVPRHKPDTIAAIVPADVRPPHMNVMDTPGIRTFEVNEVYEVGHFYYDYNKYELTAQHKIYLDTLLTQLNRHTTMRIEIRSHTDCRGGYEFNQVLSKNRALTVVNYLVKHGIDRKRLEYVGLGYSQPAVKCPDCNACTEHEHYLNRILEFRVLQL